jgi:hypothetical protein
MMAPFCFRYGNARIQFFTVANHVGLQHLKGENFYVVQIFCTKLNVPSREGCPILLDTRGT